jgi:hypothetical protein
VSECEGKQGRNREGEEGKLRGELIGDHTSCGAILDMSYNMHTYIEIRCTFTHIKYKHVAKHSFKARK